MAGYNYFDFFDQFQEIQVDLTPYLDEFSTEEDKLVFSNLQPVKTNLKNLFEHINVVTSYKENILLFEQYEVQDGDRIENVAYKLYKNVNYWWVIALFNNIRNPWTDWVKTDDQLHELAEKLAYTHQVYPKKTYYKLLFDKNEALRNITVLKRGHINDLVWQMRKLITAKRNERIVL